MRTSHVALGVVLALLASAASAERIYVFHNVPVFGNWEMDRIAAEHCNTMLPGWNLAIYNEVWTVSVRSRDGRIYDDARHMCGEAFYCGIVDDFSFPHGMEIPSVSKWLLFDYQAYQGSGTCTVTSETHPIYGAAMGACDLQIVPPMPYVSPLGCAGGAIRFAWVGLPEPTLDTYWTIRLHD